MVKRNTDKVLKRGMARQTLAMVVLAVLLVGSLGFIGFGKYNDMKQSEDMEIFQQGATYGYEQAVFQVAEMASTCNAVPLSIGNQTMDLVAVDCLNLPA